ncbi:MAG TPA: glycosyltransferase [Polyangiaceae bacterium]|jgi:mannosylfructose-phosphate synthase|nr:glycosyltransferase [Polyangiaceae bacterium]
MPPSRTRASHEADGVPLSNSLRAQLGLDSQLPRIAMLSTHGYVASEPPLGEADTGGQVVYVLELSKQLARLGYEVDIWTRRFDDQPMLEPVGDQVRIIRMPCGGDAFIAKEVLHESIHEWSENAVRFAARAGLKYEFVNSHYWDAGIAGMHLAEALGTAHVHTPHSLGMWKRRQMLTDFPGDDARLDAKYNFERRIHFERQIYREAALVVATTPAQTDMLRGDYDVSIEKLRMIPPGYDDNRFFPVGQASRELLRRKLGFHGKVVLCLGRLARNKGYDLLLRAFAEVLAREPTAFLWLAVGGEKISASEQVILDECQSLARELGLTERVTFAGYVEEADLPDLYRAADVFALPSRYEPFGMTAVEAMACGTPTVVTTHGGLFRIIKFGVDGLFADAFDASDLGITILKPLRYPLLGERLARNAAHTARSLFTWTGVAHQLIAAAEERASFGLPITELELVDQWFGPDDQSGARFPRAR